jgi:6-phosphogluconate dehydrogenase (decarboxylating)
MQIGMIGLGRMGASMVTRLMRGRHDCVVHDRTPQAIERLVALGATGAASLPHFVQALKPPRAVWLMVPAAAVDDLLETLTTRRTPEHFQYAMDLPQIAEVWRRGSVIGSWLLDLTASALAADPHLTGYEGRVSDSGEGRWTVQAAIDEAVPAPVLSAALYARFDSRGQADFANQVLSAMRHEFGGHVEKPGPEPTRPT